VSDAAPVSARVGDLDQALGAAEEPALLMKAEPVYKARNTQPPTTALKHGISAVEVSTSNSNFSRSSSSRFSTSSQQLLDVVPAPEAGKVDLNGTYSSFSRSVRSSFSILFRAASSDDVAADLARATLVERHAESEIVRQPSARSSPGEGENACRICGIIKFYQSAAQEECGSRGKCATCCNCSLTNGLWSKADFHSKSCEQCRVRRIAKNARRATSCRVLTASWRAGADHADLGLKRAPPLEETESSGQDAAGATVLGMSSFSARRTSCIANAGDIFERD